MKLPDIALFRGLQVPLARGMMKIGRAAGPERVLRRVLDGWPTHYPALTSLGRLLMLQQRFEEAIDIWTRAVAISPQWPHPNFQLARALHRSRRFEAAMLQYLQVVAVAPDHPRAFTAIEELSRRLGRTTPGGATAFDAAVARAQQILDDPAASPKMRLNALTLLAALHTQGDPDAALGYWQQVAALSPGDSVPLLQGAHIHRRQGRPGDAIAGYRAVLDRAKDHPDALTGLGQVLAETDRPAALAHYASWSRRRRSDLLPLTEIAALHFASGERAESEAAFAALFDRVRRKRASMVQLAAHVSRDAKRSALALELWRQAAARVPGDPYPHLERAAILERLSHRQEADDAYRSALACDGADPTALFGLARSLTAQGRWSDAAPLYEALHRVRPGRTDVLLGLGRSYERLDRADEALVAYGKLLKIDPAHNGALYHKGRLLRQLGRGDEAIALWQELCRRGPHNADAWFELGFLLASAEREDEALAVFDAAESALPATPGSWSKLGLAAQAAQFNERAVAYFERAIAAEPEEPAHHSRLGGFYLRLGIADGAFHHLSDARELRPTDVAIARQLVDAVHALNQSGVDQVTLTHGPRRSGEVLVPERLFERVRVLADTEVVPYVPVPRRILSVTASLAGGGAERQLVNLLRGLSDPTRELDLVLLCTSLARRNRRDFLLPYLEGTGVEVVSNENAVLDTCLRHPAVAPYAQLIRAFPIEMSVPIACWLAEFRERRPEVVHAWQDGTNLSAAVAALLAGVPKIVLGARSVRPDNPRRRLKRFMRDGYRAVLGHPSVVLSNNSAAGAADYADWLGIEASSIAVVKNGLDFAGLEASADPAKAAEIRHGLGIPESAPVVGSVFRMSEEKRPLLWVEVAAEVLRRVPTAHFIVCGDGPMRGDMLALATGLGIADRLHLPGLRDEIGSWYRTMDVVLLTSRHEGLPNVLLEAQSLGIPVVAPDVGGVSEVMEHGTTGWAVRDADAVLLAERVTAALSDEDWSSRARVEAHAYVRREFGISTMVARTLNMYGIDARND